MSADVVLDDDADGESKPKKEKIKKPKNKANRDRGGAVKWVILAFVLVLLAVLIAVVGFNALNLRDRYLTDTLRNVPLVNRLLPVEEEVVETTPATLQPNTRELQARIDELEALLEESQDAERALSRRVEMHVEEILRLQEIEDNQLQFRADKEAFDRMIAMNDPAAYANFYASIAPENAQTLGPQAESAANRAKEVTNFLKTIGAMEEKEAALMLTEMIRSDLDLVVSIIKDLPADFSGGILTAMEPRDAATIVKRWSP